MHIIRSMPHDFDFQARLMRANSELLFPVRGFPRRLDPGDTVFFSHRGRIVGRSKLRAILPIDLNDDMGYLEQGTPDKPHQYNYLCVGTIKPIRARLEFVGRVGIRYVDNLKSKKLKTRLLEMIL